MYSFEGTPNIIPSNSTCENCGEMISRSPRESNAPRIHHGLIASGDRVMRNARKRDSARQNLGDVLCFEMEAAGILTEFPCLVIRGISDYADSHKNDIWQNYAAAAAAGCTKELLSYLTPKSVFEQLALTKKQRQRLLESLKFRQIDARKMAIKKGYAKTCEWLLKTAEYVQWLDNSKLRDHWGVLWIKGKPGAGKSTLMKFALNFDRPKEETIILSFFFNARGEDLEKSTVGMYRSLIWQLLTKVPKLVQVFDSLDRTTWRGDEDYPWTIESLSELFKQAVLNVGRSSVMCFIDALDECEEMQVRDMLRLFQNVGESALEGKILFRILLSSRHYPHISIKRGLELVVEGQKGHDQDMANYVDSELNIGNSRLARQIRRDLQDKASGVFMWLVLVVQILNKEYDRGRMHALRQKLQDIPGDLHELFRDILKRGDDTDHSRNELLLCIQWVLFAKRPLRPEQLYCALLSGLDPEALMDWNSTSYIENDDVIRRYILDCSKGLAETTRSEIPNVQFIHESVRDFLLNEDAFVDLWPELGSNFEGQSHEKLKLCCFEYITSGTFGRLDYNMPVPEASSREMTALRNSTTNEFPLLEYAVCNVLYHAETAAGSGVSQEAFLQNFPPPFWSSLHNLFVNSKKMQYTPTVSLGYILAEKSLPNLIAACLPMQSWVEREDEHHGLPLFAALATGHKTTVQAILKNYARSHPPGSKLHDLYCQYAHNTTKPAMLGRDFEFSNERTVLSYIVELGDEVLFAFLLETGKFMPDGEDKGGRTPLSWAAVKGHETIVKLLLADERVDPNSNDKNGNTPLSLAAEEGHKAILWLLVADQRVDLNSQDKHGQSVLSQAAQEGYIALVGQLLADERVDPNSQDNYGRTPLLRAAQGGREVVVKQLLADQRVDPDSKDDEGWTPLSWAAETGHKEVVKLLLADQRVDPDSKDDDGWTPLLWAAEGGHKAVVKLLLADQRVDPNSEDTYGRTPILWAARRGHKAVVNLLLADQRVDPNSKDTVREFTSFK